MLQKYYRVPCTCICFAEVPVIEVKRPTRVTVTEEYDVKCKRNWRGKTVCTVGRPPYTSELTVRVW